MLLRWDWAVASKVARLVAVVACALLTLWAGALRAVARKVSWVVAIVANSPSASSSAKSAAWGKSAASAKAATVTWAVPCNVTRHVARVACAEVLALLRRRHWAVTGKVALLLAVVAHSRLLWQRAIASVVAHFIAVAARHDKLFFWI